MGNLCSPLETGTAFSQPLSNLAFPPRSFSDRKVTAWRRFAPGLWRMQEGDISKAYCAHTFPRLRVFREDGQFYANCGMSHCGMRTEAACYPLFPEAARPFEKEPHSYQGQSGYLEDAVWWLGPMVTFVSDEPTVGECTALLRVQFADAGSFAHHATYTEFLRCLPQALSQNEQITRTKELTGEFAKLAKAEMESLVVVLPHSESGTGRQLQLI
jgi:hypothetical protein